MYDSYVTLVEVAGALITLLSIGGALILAWSGLTRRRQNEELLLLTPATGLLGWFALRSLLPSSVATWGFATLFSVVALSALLHSLRMWPDYIAVTVMTLAMCAAGYLLLLDVIG